MDTTRIPGYTGDLFVPKKVFSQDCFWIGKSFQRLINEERSFEVTDPFIIDRKKPMKDRGILTVPRFLFGISYLVSLQKEGQSGFLSLDGMTSIGPIDSPFDKDVLLYAHLTFFKEDMRWKCSLRDVAGIITIQY